MEDAAPKIERADIEAAFGRIARRIRRTPILDLGPGAFGVCAHLELKLELLQHTGSFKVRGAFNRILSAEVPGAGVIAASGGNFGLAVAYAARELGHKAEIFVPETSPAAKIRRIGSLGAVVHVIPGYYEEAFEASRTRAEETGALVMHAYDQPEVVAGQGTLGLELSQQVPGADTVLIAVGGGGLIGGVASWFAGAVRVVGVEPDRCPTLHAALAAGHPIDVDVGGIAADSLGASCAGVIGFAAAERFVERVVLVPDEAIRDAQLRLWEEVRLIAEAGGVTSLAALLCGAYRPEPNERVVALVCGANTDPTSLAR
ncbi:MAG: threonine/serine dehydratase [Actinomycetota bacterium]